MRLIKLEPVRWYRDNDEGISQYTSIRDGGEDNFYLSWSSVTSVTVICDDHQSGIARVLELNDVHAESKNKTCDSSMFVWS